MSISDYPLGSKVTKSNKILPPRKSALPGPHDNFTCMWISLTGKGFKRNGHMLPVVASIQVEHVGS